jgi:predicted MFS family arabinose efflux permease
MSTQDQKLSLPMTILVAGSMCVLMAMGLRASMGLYLKPMSVDLGWGREVFALAMALQNLLWGVFQPFAAAAADRWGAGRVVAGGGALYFVGLYMMAEATQPAMFHLSAGLLVGMAQSGCALAVVLGAVGRTLPEDKRSMGLGVVTAAGAAGQFTVVPIGQVFLSQYGWSTSCFLLAVMALSILVCAAFLRGKPAVGTSVNQSGEAPASMGEMLRVARRHRGFWLLTAGFFVCGFHVAFIGVHMPAFLSDRGLPAQAGAWSLALIGLFNVIGSMAAGYLGGRWSKKYLLSILYTLRSIAILLFIVMPITLTSVMVFSAAMGILWLSTVPLTSGLVAQMFGTRYMGTLFAIVFLNHQIGSFLGVWLGGYFFDTYGTYDPVWWAGIVVGLLAALLHWPINEETVPEAANA